MKHYYGIIDKEYNTYGFVEEGDRRITSDFIELTEERWQELLDEQSRGLEIVFYNGEVFTAEPNRYYVDDNGIWQKRADEEIERIETNKRKENFKKDFIQTSWGWYRKQPQGYANAPQSVDIILNMVNALGSFTEQVANLMIFYTEPDFTDAEQCTEEWLVAHQTKHEPCTTAEFMQFYIDFQTCWATEQYQNDVQTA